jgi:hypothetical protein
VDGLDLVILLIPVEEFTLKKPLSFIGHRTHLITETGHWIRETGALINTLPPPPPPLQKGRGAEPASIFGWVLLHAPLHADFFENQHAEGRATIPAPPFWAGMLHSPALG